MTDRLKTNSKTNDVSSKSGGDLNSDQDVAAQQDPQTPKNMVTGNDSAVDKFTQDMLQSQQQFIESELQQQSPAKNADATISVLARVRPMIPNEKRHPVCVEIDDDSEQNGYKTKIFVKNGIPGKNVDKKVFQFEKVLDPSSSQQQVFTQIKGRALCNSFLDGQNCTIFVYGPTSTGKTFTMQGNAE